MEHEYEVLNHLQENEITTQRKISKRTGLSLGAVNLLLKKMARKGLIKVEKLNARTMRYILTPKGLQEKSRLAYRYIRQSYRQILKINQALDRLLSERSAELGREAVILLGPADEILEVLTQHLSYKEINFEVCPDLNSLEKLVNSNGRLILTWRQEEEEAMDKGLLRTVNIMKIL
jgi:DNA-binding MarR family transcriptional regulator